MKNNVSCYLIINTKQTGYYSGYDVKYTFKSVGKYFIGTQKEAKDASKRHHIVLLKTKKPLTIEMSFEYKWRGTHFYN